MNGVIEKREFSQELLEKAARVRMLVLDVDGVLTDGNLYFDNSGNEMKAFSTRDGFGMRCLQRHGIEAGLFIMLGYDGEQLVDIDATAEHVKAAAPDVFLTTLAYPIKGTPYHATVADRVVALRPWAEGSDRDTTVAGRPSRRFYSFATRWMVNEVAWQREQAARRRNYRRLARTYLNKRLGRLGMRLTAHEVERG